MLWRNKCLVFDVYIKYKCISYIYIYIYMYTMTHSGRLGEWYTGFQVFFSVLFQQKIC